MFKRVGHLLLIIAVLAATGTHWFVLQSVAWTSMLANNLQTAAFTVAIERTFDGNHPCCLCRQIAKSRQAEKQSDLQIEWKKFEFPYSPSVFVFNPPGFFWETTATQEIPASLNYPPPSPPPRLT